jgi:hypothetical protein
MADLLVDLVTCIVAAHLVTADGTDIFRNYAPDQPDNIVVLNEYDSSPSSLRGVAMAVRFVQVIVRNTSAATAKSKADALYHLFNDSEENIINIVSGRPSIISPKQLPFKISTDEKQRVLWGFNLAITTKID